jgi:alkanesulfonate monooxygenase SsuD/methylene tetrahydromethanopterin reductase-like flavin-dependent oxidoreductase (luciferase family)
MYSLRFDMRAPAGSTPDRYRAALDMAEWADRNGCLAVSLCEHHASPDGYLPSPLVMAAAVAARTERVPIRVVAVVAPLHDPIQLAEDMAVLDLLSAGRVSFALALGYRQEEFDLYGIPMSDRGPRLDNAVETIRAAWRGEPLPGRPPSLRVTPPPATPGGPDLYLGGGSAASTRRAARLGIGMITEAPGLSDSYAAACRERGLEPGPFLEAPAGTVTAAFIDPDPDSLWARIGPHVLHDAVTYHRWNAEAGKSGINAITAATSIDELRDAGFPYRVFTPDEAVAYIRERGPLNISPLCGGTPPEIGWETLHALAENVLPGLNRKGG